MGIFVVFPLLLITLYAFTSPGNNVVTFQFTLENFLRFFDPVYFRILAKSLYIALITTIISLIIGYPLAYFISRKSDRVQMLLMLLVTMPMWINMLIRTYAWISILSKNGLLNNLLTALNLPNVEIMYTDTAVLIGMVYNYLPFMILSIYTQLTKMDESLVAASYDLGANWRQTFSKVIFPLSLPGVITGITLVFLPAVSSFVIPKLLGGGSYMLIGNLIENQFISIGDWNFGSSVSLIMTIIIIISMYITKKVDKNIDETTPARTGGARVYGRN
jgi:spermidine/putrescine transport system permease protein